MKIGSLFSGYGGLEMGVQSVIGGEVAWHVEFDAPPSRILEHRYPGVPNYGDITTVDWSAVEPVDVLTGGFPCQDVSLAGLRRGLKEGTRSGLWSEFARAIGHLRPGLVVIENVRGLLSAVAAGPVESDPWSVGDGAVRPSLRALGAVLGDLADLGYDARWGGFRAADAGAPHSRFRVFVLAHPTSSRRSAGENVGTSGSDARPRAWSPELERGRRERPDAVEDAYIAARSEWGQSAPGQAPRRWARADAGGRGGTPSADAHRAVAGRGEAGHMAGAAGASESTEGQWQRNGDAPGHRRPAAPAWGPYASAVERWERALGRVAPPPTDPTGKGGAHRLSPAFVEWMMGLPLGWLTAPEVGLTRAQQLKALGNGVVPQQAALAVRTLLEAEGVAA